MTIKTSSRKNKLRGARAQALVEFSIALPVMIVMLVGIMEVGRMIITYALVNNASRDAVRYASAVGRSDASPNNYKYNDCAAIAAIARKSAYFVVLTTPTITYDSGPGTSSLGTCPAGQTQANISVDSGDRVTVTIQATYKPVIKLIPISQRTFTATSSRTILGILDLDN